MGNLNITAARLAPQDGRLAPFVQIGGAQWYCVDTKPSLLQAGIATAQPVLPGNWEPNWDAQPRFTATLPADPEDGRPERLAILDATDDPAVVALARKAAAQLLEETAVEGSLL